jgi:hypothetical protein
MATDRLYLVDKDTKEYLCVAKLWYFGWQAGNTDLRATFESKERNLIMGTENDLDFYNKWIREGTNFNVTSKWESDDEVEIEYDYSE